MATVTETQKVLRIALLKEWVDCHRSPQNTFVLFFMFWYFRNQFDSQLYTLPSHINFVLSICAGFFP